MDSLRELFIEQLQDAYDFEKQIMKALPKMTRAASSSELQNAFENHLEQTRRQIDRLETIFEQLDEEPEGKPCKGMAGVLAEGKEVMDEVEDDDVKDAGLIAAAQKVEHYEIATYGTLRTWAGMLDEDEVMRLLEQTLEEEKEADQVLSELADEINVEAEENSAEEEEKAPSRGRRAATGRTPARSGSMRAKSSSSRSRKRS
ncbi:MAG TPA: ferritin-like domain-containing protein [Candidatus Krumholzibacteria bacterium]